jgi:hypothetical protein
MAVERSTGTIVSGSYDGVVNRFTIGQSAAAALTGKGHTNAIVDLILTQGKLLSCGMDDTLRVSTLSDMQYSPEVTITPLSLACHCSTDWIRLSSSNLLRRSR